MGETVSLVRSLTSANKQYCLCGRHMYVVCWYNVHARRAIYSDLIIMHYRRFIALLVSARGGEQFSQESERKSSNHIKLPVCIHIHKRQMCVWAMQACGHRCTSKKRDCGQHFLRNSVFLFYVFCILSLSLFSVAFVYIFFSCCFSTMLMFRHRSQIPLPTPTLPMDLTLEFQPFRLITLRYGCAAGAEMNASQSGHHGNVPFILSVCWCRSLLSLLLSLVVVVSVLWFGVITAYPVIYGVFC